MARFDGARRVCGLDGSGSAEVPFAYVICGTCGRNNASHLVFCEECGQKLAPRLGLATPPLGVPATKGARAHAQGDARPGALVDDPGGPIVPVGTTVLRDPPRPSGAPADRSLRPQARFEPTTLRCAECGSVNADGIRYCNTCGSPLRASAVPPAGRSERLPRDAAPGEIAPARVVSVNGPDGDARDARPEVAEGALRVCPRCRGANRGLEPFCRFCGAPLGAAGGTPAVNPRAASVAPSKLPARVTSASPRPSPAPPPASPPRGNVEPFPRPAPAGSRTPRASRVPTPVTSPRLVMMSPAGTEGKVVLLEGEVTDIGRVEGDVTLPDDPYLSPRHARITRRGASTWLEDLSSTNGVYLRLRSRVSEGGSDTASPGGPPTDADRTTPEGAAALVFPDDGDRTTETASAGSSRAGEGSGAHRRRISALIPSGRLDGFEAPWSPERPATLGPLAQGRTGGGVRAEVEPAGRATAGADRAGTTSALILPYPLLPQHVLRDQDLFLVGEQVLRFEVVTHAEAGFRAASQHGTLLFGSPIAPRYARISQRTVEGVSRDVFYLRKAETVLGRESGDVVFSEDPFLSRRHAAICTDGESEDRRFLLVDLGSSNGTFVRIRHELPLQAGDQFRVGQQLFRFDLA